MYKTRFFFVACLVSGMLPLLGCGSGPDDLNPVTGVVTLDGEPLAGATVSFSPVSEGSGRPAVGTTDEQGVYQLTDMRFTQAGPGAAPGKYHVTISKTSVAEESLPEEDDPNYGDLPDPTSTGTGVESLVPEKYTDRSSSGLTATVESGANENVDFELTTGG